MVTSRFIPVLALVLTLAASSVAAYAAADATASVDEAVRMETTVPESATSPDDVAGPAAATPEADAPHEAAATEGEGGLPQLNIATYPSQIFWLLVMFTVLYVAFSRKILPSIGGVVEARDGMIKGNLDAAQSLKEQAEGIQASYERNLEAARAQAMQAVQDVENAAKKKAADQIEGFRKKSDTELKSAEERVLGVKSAAMGQMTGVAAEVASIAAEKITGISTDRSHAHAIVEGIAGKAKAA